jgi:NitT/TauT family transport system substrate-binding protein
MKKLLESLKSVFFAASVSALFGACVPALAETRETNQVTVATGSDIALTAVVVVALDKGYFKEEGLNVQWRMFGSGAEASQSLATGAIPLGIMAETPAISLRANGVPVVMLTSVSDLAEGEVLWVGSDLDVKKPEDLHGLRIAYRSGSTGDLQINQIARKYNLDLGKMQLVNLSPADAVTAYAAKQIDGVVAWEPYLFAASQQRPLTLLHTGRTSYFSTNHGAKVTVAPAHGVLMAREEYVRKNPNATMAFMRAIVKAQSFIDGPQNRDDLVRLAANLMKQREDYIRASISRFELRVAIAPILESDLHTVGDFMQQVGRLKGNPPLRTWLYSDPLKQVKPEWVTLSGTWQP